MVLATKLSRWIAGSKEAKEDRIKRAGTVFQPGLQQVYLAQT
jgi:hypothetical protein